MTRGLQKEGRRTTETPEEVTRESLGDPNADYFIITSFSYGVAARRISGAM